MWASVRKFLVEVFFSTYERFGLSHPLLCALVAFVIAGGIGVVLWQFIGFSYRGSLPRIFLDCHRVHVPIAFPASTTILSLEPRATPNSGFSEYMTSALEREQLWPSRTANEDVYLCEFDNRSGEGILKTELAFGIVIREALSVPGSSTAKVTGEARTSYSHSLSIPELRPGKFGFYVRNNLSDFLALHLPERLTFEGRTGRRIEIPIQRLGSEQWITLGPAN
jgi:hypothetical protein